MATEGAPVMNPIIQNIAGALTAVGVTVGGMVGIDARYIDTNEAGRLYELRREAQAHLRAQLSVNTSVAATLIDLRVRQYQYTASTTKNPVERNAMLAQIEVAQKEMKKLGENFEAFNALHVPLVIAGGE